LLQISPTPVISSIIGGNPCCQRRQRARPTASTSPAPYFGRNFSFYNALSYNQSNTTDNYNNGAALVPTAGKNVPGSPEWMNKFVAIGHRGRYRSAADGDYVGKRYATYTNDLSVPSYFLMGLGVSGKLPAMAGWLKNPLPPNVSNLANREGDLNVVVGAATRRTTPSHRPRQAS
jgi:hypothetical protein